MHDAGLSLLPSLLLPLLAAGAALLRERRTRTAPLVVVAAAASVVAAVVHAIVVPEHFGESPLYGWFFVLTAVAGFGYAFWLGLRPSRSLLLAGAAANAAIVALWIFTRVVEVPLGPGAGQTEPVGMLDVIASVAELTALAAVVVAVWRGGAAWAPRLRQARWLPSQRSAGGISRVQVSKL